MGGAAPFVLLPLLTNKLSPAEYGRIVAIFQCAAIMTGVLSISANSYIFNLHQKGNRLALTNGLRGAFLLVFLLHVSFAFAVLPILDQLAHFIGLTTEDFFLSLACSYFASCNAISLSLFQSAERPKQYMLIKGIQAFIEVGLCILVIQTIFSGYESRAYSYLIAVAAAFLLCVRDHRHNGYAAFNESISLREILPICKFGLSLLPHTLAGIALAYSDRLIVSAVMGNASLGVYGVAMQFAMVMAIVNEPLNKTISPWLFKKLKINDQASKAEVAKITMTGSYAIIALGAVIAVLGYTICPYIVATSFEGAQILIPILTVGYIFQGLYYMVVNHYFFYEKTARLSGLTVVATLLGAGICLFATVSFGLMGAAVSFAITNALLFFFVWMGARKLSVTVSATNENQS